MRIAVRPVASAGSVVAIGAACGGAIWSGAAASGMNAGRGERGAVFFGKSRAGAVRTASFGREGDEAAGRRRITVRLASLSTGSAGLRNCNAAQIKPA
ncbi:hypothetical protein [Lysobacter antibioticus]|uniref:hypothetical protein n=1 Tax=Lysobacter antibioticus TaxID=84531 RepID=UPI00126A118B|nr:hypothetical protein [Lysobacter antibioticus]